jgi:hypothetical protein
VSAAEQAEASGNRSDTASPGARPALRGRDRPAPPESEFP